MEWIRISPNKLKVMLTAEDAKHYDLDCSNAGCTDILTRAAFRDILLDVCRETGFDTEEDKTYIQMYPSKEGGCELFITRIGLLFTNEKYRATAHGAKKTSPALPISAQKNNRAFLFLKMGALLGGCRALLGNLHIHESHAWRDDRSHFWLVLEPRQDGSLLELDALFEFGEEVAFENAFLFLEEHATAICERNAVQTLGTLI